MTLGYRSRRFDEKRLVVSSRVHAVRLVRGRALGAMRRRKPGHSGLWYVAVKREHRQYVAKHARSTRCVMHAPRFPQKPVAPAVRKSMRGNKGKDTKPEMLVRAKLREEGLSGYRLQWHAPGRPDIAYPGKKVALFINGCFWHRCPRCKPSMPKSNQEYWIPKFERNVERDRRNVEALEADGWRVHVIWECQLNKKNREETFSRLIPQLRVELGRMIPPDFEG